MKRSIGVPPSRAVSSFTLPVLSLTKRVYLTLIVGYFFWKASMGSVGPLSAGTPPQKLSVTGPEPLLIGPVPQAASRVAVAEVAATPCKNVRRLIEGGTGVILDSFYSKLETSPLDTGPEQAVHLLSEVVESGRRKARDSTRL